MYLEGLGFSSICRIFEVSHVSVLTWIRKYCCEVETIRNYKPVRVMELNELHTYIELKNLSIGFGHALVEMIENTLISFWETEVQKQATYCGIK